MKVFAISDLHLSFDSPKPMDIFGGKWDNYLDKITESWTQLVGDDDIVLIPGDISWAMFIDKAVVDINWIGRLPGHKVILRGNHDYWWKSINQLRQLLPSKMYALQNDCIRIGKTLICGTRGWALLEGNKQTPEDDKIYLREGERLKLSIDAMTKMRQSVDRVVAMFHYPPFDARLGATNLTNLISASNIQCVTYGHLHGKQVRSIPIVEIDKTKYYLSSCDLVDNKLVLLTE